MSAGIATTAALVLLAWDLALDPALEHDIDAVYFGDDWGQQHGLQMGYGLWKRFLYPHLRRQYASVLKAVSALHCLNQRLDVIPHVAHDLVAECAIRGEMLGLRELQRWRPLLEQCISAYRRAEYLITIPSLLAVYEGALATVVDSPGSSVPSAGSAVTPSVRLAAPTGRRRWPTAWAGRSGAPSAARPSLSSAY